MKTVHFIRHAESQANAGEATQNDESIELTRIGKLQAIALTNSISEKPDLIICSKYIRTQQTAAPLIHRYPQITIKILPLHEFTYLSPSLCAGTTPNQRKNWVCNYWEQAGPDFIQGDGAESFNQFIQRVDCCLQCIEFCEAQNIVVFTHGHVLRAIWQQLMYLEFPSDQARFSHFHQNMGLLPVPNACLYKAIFQKNQWQIIEPQPAHFLT
jgi:probable phosphoglycerate mutase